MNQHQDLQLPDPNYQYQDKSYEENNFYLQSVLRFLQQGNPTLEQTQIYYRRAMEVHKFVDSQLQEFEREIEMINPETGQVTTYDDAKK